MSKGLLLQSLDVSHTNLGDEGITVLADSLCQYPPPPLVMLDLTGVPLGPLSLTALGAALADGSGLKGLHVTLPQVSRHSTHSRTCSKERRGEVLLSHQTPSNVVYSSKLYYHALFCSPGRWTASCCCRASPT